LNNYYLFLLILPLFYFFNNFLIKNKILLDQISTSNHKIFLNKDLVPLSGGILIFISLVFFIKDLSYFDKLLLSFVFFLGLLSDLQKLKSPIIRLALQVLIICTILLNNDVYVQRTALKYIDYLIQNYFILKFCFTVFCLTILINGTNFIDGVNGLSGGYYFIVIVNILLHSINNKLLIDHYNFILLLQFLSVFLLFNFFSKSFMGDSGSYLISIYLGIYLISYANHFQNLISPYYVCLLLWYPAFENLFSILRRKLSKKGFSTYADNEHLHHFLYKFINKKIKNRKLSNSLSGITINSVNFLFIYMGGYFVNSTKPLAFLIILLISLYLLSYFYLKKNNV